MDSRTEEGHFLLDLPSWETNDVGSTLFPYIKTSPSYTKIAFWDLSDQALRIIAADGNIVYEYHNEDNDFYPVLWLSDDILILHKTPRDVGNLTVNFVPYFLYINTNELETISFDVPEVYPGVPKNWYGAPQEIPNPDQTILVYPSFRNDLTFWDLNTNQTIRTVFQGSLYGREPKWSKTRAAFLISAPPVVSQGNQMQINFDDGLPYIGGEELFSIDSEGKLTRMTFLSTQYNSLFFDYVWSPNEEKIAAWLSLDEYESPEPLFTVVDTSSDVITNYCITGNRGGLYWSPNGKYLALNAQPQNDSKNPSVIIVDFENSIAYRIISQHWVDGWISNEE